MFTPASRACAYRTASGRGKWLSRDPLGEAGGIAVHAFVANSPLNALDPFGLTGGNPVSMGPGIPVAPGSPSDLFRYNPWDPSGASMRQSMARAVTGVLVTMRVAGDAVGGTVLILAPTGISQAGGVILYADAVDTLKAAFTGKGYSQQALEAIYGEGAPGIDTALLVKDLSVMTAGFASAVPKTATVGDISRAVGDLVRNRPCKVQVTVQEVTVPAANNGGRLVHMSGAADDVLSSGKLGLPSNNYAGPASNAGRSGWSLTSRTGLNPNGTYSPVPIPAAGEAAFSEVVPIGPVTAWQRLTGQQYTARGILDLNTGAFTRSGLNWNQVGIYSFDAAVTGTAIGGGVYLWNLSQ